MEIPKQREFKNPHLVLKVAIFETIKHIPVGQTVTFDCREAGPISSARSVVCRLNRLAEAEEYTIITPDNGATYLVTHNNILTTPQP